jgi:FkbM family methyltransferase
MGFLTRLLPVAEGIVNYGNPMRIFLQRVFLRTGEMTIVDRKSGVSVRAMRQSYHMFGETWYTHDYDVGGCALRKDDVVVDVGANQGFFTCYAAERGAEVYAFEPNPKTFQLLKKNIRANGFADRVHPQCVAVADFEGETELVCSSFMDGGADTIHAKRAEGISRIVDQKEKLRVPVLRLGSLIPPERRIRLLKLDCEGSELDILKGLETPERFDSMAIEFHEHAYPIEELLMCLLGFGTHQVYSAHGHIIHAVRTDVLLDYARNQG